MANHIRVLCLRALASCALVGSIGISAALADSKPAYTEGQTVEVREGDTWSPATFEKQEGRKFQIKYADGTEEWVGADRLRTSQANAKAGGSGSDAPAAAGADESKAPAKVKYPEWSGRVEVKWGGLYREAKIMNRRDEWYLVSYDNGVFKEWVEPWRIRKLGSTVDDLPPTTPNETMTTTIGPPPRKNVGPKPGVDDWKKTPEQKAAEKETEISADPLFRKSDRNRAESLDFGAPAAWTFVPEPAVESSSIRSAALRGLGAGTWLTITGLAVCRTKPIVVVGYNNKANPTDKGELELQKLDLSTGESLGTFNLGPELILLDVSPDGKKAMVRSDGWDFGKKDQLEIWSIEAATPRKLWFFTPYGDSSSTGRDIAAAHWVDDNHILTHGSNDTTLWQLEPLAAVWSTAGSEAVLSASGKTLVLKTRNSIAVADPLTGKIRGNVTGENLWGGMAISPSGKTLVVHSYDVVKAWNLETGEYLGSTAAPYRGVNAPMMIDDTFALLSGSVLFDVRKRLPVWAFWGLTSQGAMLPNGTPVFAIADPERKLTSIVPARLVGSSMIASDKALDPAKLLAVQPGATVSIAFDGAVPDDKKPEIIARRTKQLKSLGFAVADGSPIRLLLSVAAGKSEQKNYVDQRDPFHGTGQNVNVASTVCSVTWQVNGKALWTSTQVATLGWSVQLKKGQSLDQAAADAAQPNMAFLGGSQLPAYVPATTDFSALGASEVTSRGIVPK